MPYPAIYTRLFNFQRDANNSLPSPAPAKVDAELNAVQLSLAQQNTVLRGITTADGRLRNVAAAIAASLAGTSSVTSGGTTALVTTIPWVASPAFSPNTVLVMQGAVLLRPAQIASVQDDGLGFLQVNLAVAPTLGTLMVVWAFEPGAGILARLQSSASGDGASLVTIHDAGNFYGAVTVEGALAEVAGSLFALQTALGDLAEYFKRDGSVVATGDFDMGGFKIVNAADGVDPGDYVTVRQITNYIAAWTNLSRFFLKRDGTTAMAGNLNFGNNRGYNLADPDLTQPLDAVNVRSLLRVIATSGAAPVGTCIDFVGDTAPSPEWLLCDGQVYAASAYPVLSALLAASYRTGEAQGCIAARFPAMIAGTGTNPGDVNGGALVVGNITSLLLQPGQGYTGVPKITVQNPEGEPAPTVQPTFAVVVSTPTLVGATVTDGGVLTSVIITGGGTGIKVDCVLIVENALAATPTTKALQQMPNGYFRVPDLRGRFVIGAGTESKEPGVVDPPDVTAGDKYTADPMVIGEFGGSQLAVGNHKHHMFNTNSPVADAWGGTLGAQQYASGRTSTSGGSADEKYNIQGTSLASTRGITSDPTAPSTDTRPPFHCLNKLIKAK